MTRCVTALAVVALWCAVTAWLERPLEPTTVCGTDEQCAAQLCEVDPEGCETILWADVQREARNRNEGR